MKWLKKVGWMSSDKAWALLQYPLLTAEKSEITAGRSALFGLYLEDYWELGEVPLLFSIPFILYLTCTIFEHIPNNSNKMVLPIIF